MLNDNKHHISKVSHYYQGVAVGRLASVDDKKKLEEEESAKKVYAIFVSYALDRNKRCEFKMSPVLQIK